MELVFQDRGPSPVALKGPGSEYRDGTAGRWGAFSIETFASASPLRYTHEDAKGWLDHLTQFTDRNFWFADSGVQVWAYEEANDNWQDRYGMDAVMAVYHSGHGTMLSDGTFIAPMGGTWDGRSDARSNNMRLGNEKANYVFFSTCLSLRVHEGHSPSRTWAVPNLGFRMLFGFETISIDDPNYGKFFWEEWRKGKTLAQAWLDASWRISTRQSPSVAACGATREEAVNRLNTERFFSNDHVSDDWWAWRWYEAARTERQRGLQVPLHPPLVLLEPRTPSAELRDLARQARIDAAEMENIPIEQQQVLSVSTDGRRIATGPTANRWLQLAEPNRSNTTPLDESSAVEAARRFVDEQGHQGLVLESVHEVKECCGRASGEIESPHVVETMVTFRQEFGGINVITPGRGEIRVAVDNDGRVVSVNNSTREFARSSGHLTADVGAPEPPSGGAARLIETPDPRQALDQAQQGILDELRLRGADERQLQVRDVTGSAEVGYEVEGNEAYLVARKQIEIGPFDAPEEESFVARRWVTARLAR
jgi:hypothetical protein